MDLPGQGGLAPTAAGKLETELGWRAKESFNSGVEKTVRWYLASDWAARPLRERVRAGERQLLRVAAI